MKGNFIRSDDAVSEMVDYTIILGVILLATGIIVVAGVPMMENMQEVQHTENIRQSFEVMSLNMNKVVFGNAPSQSVEMKMYGGALSVVEGNKMIIDLQIWNSSANTTEMVYGGAVRIASKNVENNYKGNTISYENTGVWAKYEEGEAVMVTEPRFTYANNVMVIPITFIEGTDSISGTGLVRVTANGGSKDIDKYENVSMMNISVTSEHFEAWGRYFNESLQMPIVMEDSNNETINCSKNYLPNIDVYIINSPMKVTID